MWSVWKIAFFFAKHLLISEKKCTFAAKTRPEKCKKTRQTRQEKCYSIENQHILI